ncbi:MAG: bacteriophage holin [Candidatus Hydrothermarchaeota archaeon]|jgi:hypothetical protein|nr:bacteriophage holin [Candidatus Hydrothermarchaeota archaeon]
MKETHLDPKVAGLTLGVFWGVGLFLCTLVSMFTGYAKDPLALIITVYPGYTVTYLGSVVGLIYGLIDGFIVGFLVVWIYNKLSLSGRI